MNEKEQAQQLMRETGFPPVDETAVVKQSQHIDLAQVTKDLELRVQMVDRIHTIIQKQINPETDIKCMGDKYRRTINFARKCFRIVGGSIKWDVDPKTGMKYRRESLQDDEGNWYAITVSCVYTTPWGEEVEAFKRLTSREPFFGVEDGGFKDGAKVSDSDIVEMAVTEAFKSAVFTALGLPKDISPDELKKFGVAGEKATGHSFDGAKGAQGGNPDSDQESYDCRKKIEVICKRLADSGYEHDGAVCATAVDVLKNVTANPAKGWGGWGNFRAIKENQLPKILEQVEKIEASRSGGADGWPAEPGSNG